MISSVVAVVALAVMPQMAVAMSAPSTFQEAYQKGAEARVEFKVVDDLGLPVSGATINVFFDMVDRGMGRRIIGDTDTNGVYVAEAKTMGVLEIKVSREGYYSSTDRISFIDMGREHEVKDGRWQPWGMQKEIVLKPCRNRVALHNSWKICDFPSTNVWFGYDFEKNDFVEPFGKGDASDIKLMFEWDGKNPGKQPSTALHVAFDGQFGGGYYAGKHCQSLFPYVYSANTNDMFATKTIDYSHRFEGVPGRGGKWIDNEFDESKSLIVRTRCKVDEEGNIVMANYANITKMEFSAGWEGKGVFTIQYFFNPTPNDPNLEPK